MLVVMGDLNAKVGQYRNGNIVGPCGMGEKNERGDQFQTDCTAIATWFKIILNYVAIAVQSVWNWS